MCKKYKMWWRRGLKKRRGECEGRRGEGEIERDYDRRDLPEKNPGYGPECIHKGER